MFHVEPKPKQHNSDVTDEFSPEEREEKARPVLAADVEAILREEGWLSGPATVEIEQWLRDAAESLGLQIAVRSGAENGRTLRDLLRLIFSYDAAKMLELKENQAVMAREGAREVIRELANRVLAGGELDSERLREIIAELKGIFGSHGRKIFYPLRLALAGRTGEGDLDRVILLLDRAARLPFGVPVKSARQRMMEFCTALS